MPFYFRFIQFRGNKAFLDTIPFQNRGSSIQEENIPGNHSVQMQFPGSSTFLDAFPIYMQFPGSRDALMPFHFSHSFQEGKHSLMPFQFRCCSLEPLYLQHVVSLWWITLNTEIKDLLLRIQSYQRLFLQCQSSSEYIFMCFTYCQKFSISHFRVISSESSLKNACPWSEQVD